MMNYKYVVESFFDDAKVTVETNDPEVAVLEMIQRDMDGVHAHCIDGLTGEVLSCVNHPDQFTTPEFALMTLGVLLAQLGESDPGEGEDIPGEVVAEIPVVAVRCDAIAEQPGGDLILAMIEQLIAEGKATHLPS